MDYFSDTELSVVISFAFAIRAGLFIDLLEELVISCKRQMTRKSKI